MERAGNKCEECGGDAIVAHHVVPIAKGGSNSTSNGIALCDPCHHKAHGMRPPSRPRKPMPPKRHVALYLAEEDYQQLEKLRGEQGERSYSTLITRMLRGLIFEAVEKLQPRKAKR